MPRVLIASPRGSSGKTMVTIGICAALRTRGVTVQPFKKGPDYIDAGWLASASGRDCRNLDLFMMEEIAVLRSFAGTPQGAIAVVEGAMGLFDGIDVEGSGSTAALARLIQSPVILVVDATKMTRSVAALVNGYRDFEQGISLAGIVLNNVASARHKAMLEASISRYCGLPVLGSLPRVPHPSIKQRHLGLVPHAEQAQPTERIARLAQLVEEHLDMGEILRLANACPPMSHPGNEQVGTHTAINRVRIGVVRDEAFSFYYPDNLDALIRAGAEIVPIDSMEDRRLPAVDALYIGGGFPEVHAAALEANDSLRADIRQAVHNELPVYAECAGLMYLARSIRWGDRKWEMVEALPLDIEMTARPRGHGYVLATVDQWNPVFPIGTVLMGHEFHYSRPLSTDGLTFAYKLRRGTGCGQGADGIVHRNVLASYLHLHGEGRERWADHFVAAIANRPCRRESLSA